MKNAILILSLLMLSSLCLRANYVDGNFGVPCAVEPCCPPSCWYFATHGAVVWQNHLTFETKSAVHLNNASEKFEYKVGGSGSVAIGMNLSPCWRFEVEGLYQRNSMKSVALSGVPILDLPVPFGAVDLNRSYPANGSISDFALMGNLFYDFNLGCCFKIYLGAGLGVAFNHIRFTTITFPFVGSIGVVSTQDFANAIADVLAIEGFSEAAAIMRNIKSSSSHTYFAWNVMGGLSYELTPCWILDLGYRLFVKTKIKFNEDAFGKSNIPLTHRAEIGLRYLF